MSQGWRGLTWDHPRGYQALEAAAQRAAESAVSISWDRHPLEGFESHPVAELCADYDLIVLDHPHVGDAVAAGCLTPLEELFLAHEIAGWNTKFVGRSAASYKYAGRHWALPLDAATQVMAHRRDSLDAAPQTWEQVIALAGRQAVVLSLSGPHSILCFLSVCAALGATPGEGMFMERVAGREAYGILLRLAQTSPRELRNANPISILEHMSSRNDVVLCPLVYGYVNYAGNALAFSDAPRAYADGPVGSILGGTGIGISRRARPSQVLLNHLRWLMSDDAQRSFIPAEAGQPARRSAWCDPAVNKRSGGFYSDTLHTLEQATLRPRYKGAIAFQSAAAERLRQGLLCEHRADAVLADLQELHDRFHEPGAEL